MAHIQNKDKAENQHTDNQNGHDIRKPKGRTEERAAEVYHKINHAASSSKSSPAMR
jgi:hypothetical protein